MPPKTKNNKEKEGKVLNEKDINNEPVNTDKQTISLQSTIEEDFTINNKDSKNTKEEKEIKLITNDKKKLSPSTSLVTCVLDGEGEEEECVSEPIPLQQDMDKDELYAYETLKTHIESNIAHRESFENATLCTPMSPEYTELGTAARRGDVDLISQLLSDGADVNGTDSEGMTALMHASEIGSSPAVESLLRHIAKTKYPFTAINLKTEIDGLTALMAASKGDHLVVAELLINAGARTDLKSKSGQNALNFATSNEMRDFLKSAQIDTPQPFSGQDSPCICF